MASLLHDIQHHSVTIPAPLPLDSGQVLGSVTIAYQSYGALNADKSNAVLICHALTGDQYVASNHPATGKPGWWARMVGPGKPIDTDRFHVICANVIGGCMGSTGPASLAANFPERAARVLAIATTARHSAQNIAFHEVGRQAVMADPDWQGGEYYGSGRAAVCSVWLRIA